MRLSDRCRWPVDPSPWAEAVQRHRARGSLLDLTCSNPTAVGLGHPPGVYEALRHPDVARYEPHALGLPSARAAVAAYYGRRGRAVDPERVWLCASTSEAYAQLLTLLADPGDAVLVPAPGYPLLDMLGELTGIRRVPYPLHFDGRWFIDPTGLRDVLAQQPRARVLTAVSPHNPTGAMLDPTQWTLLQQVAAEHELALVIDEVFADYPHQDADGLRFVGDDTAPCLVLSGLSKVAALPQLKLSWVVMHGPQASIAPLRARAEVLADAYLSVNTPVQLALPALLDAAERLQPRIRDRLGANVARLSQAVAGQPLDLLPAQGGWTALLRLPRVDELDDQGWALRMLDAGVLVQPGFLFDLPSPPRIAVSLLTPPDVFARGAECIVDVVNATLPGND